MTKIHRIISLSDDVIADINHRRKHSVFNFSDWVERTYRKEFLNLEQWEEERHALQKRLQDLDATIVHLHTRDEELSAQLTREQRRFLLGVPGRIKDGKNWKALHTFYCTEYGRNCTLKEFRDLVARIKDETST